MGARTDRHSVIVVDKCEGSCRNHGPLRGRLEGHGIFENDFRLVEATGFGTDGHREGHREGTDWPSLEVGRKGQNRLEEAAQMGARTDTHTLIGVDRWAFDLTEEFFDCRYCLAAEVI